MVSIIESVILENLDFTLLDNMNFVAKTNRRIKSRLSGDLDYAEAQMEKHLDKLRQKVSNKIYSWTIEYNTIAVLGFDLWADLSKGFVMYPYSAYYRRFYQLEKLDIGTYVSLYRKHFITEGWFRDIAKFLGYDNETILDVLNATKYYPSVSDTISFAVREAFEPDSELFIHGANAIPEPFRKVGKSIGLDEQWIKKFWHSHWRLLGAEQVLEAFHRGFIQREQLLDYLRRLDYTENDREVILNMSYNLLTRVDVRRVFENGLMSSKELFDYYGILGFSEKDKTLMTSLSKQLRFIDMKDLRNLYIDEFENGLITETEVKENLRNTGLDNDEISLFLYYSDKVNELKFKTDLKNQITQRFYEGIIDFDELVEQLRELGVSNRELKRIEKNAVLFDFRKTKLPTLAELKRFLKKEIIDLSKFVYYALRIGYGSEHIFFILRDMNYSV